LQEQLIEDEIEQVKAVAAQRLAELTQLQARAAYTRAREAALGARARLAGAPAFS
jgi:hypothetical protein